MSSLPTFLLSKDAFHDTLVTIRDPDVIRQMRKVLRLQSGATFIALDGERHEYTCVIDHINHTIVRGKILRVTASNRETHIPLFLYPALIRRERFATLLEKCTELGVTSFHPTAATRSPYHTMSQHLRMRWEAIIREATEVAKRGVLPSLQSVTSLAESLAAIPQDQPVFFLSLAEGAIPARSIPALLRDAHAVSLFVGPEGDYTEEEYALFRVRGAVALSLGPRVVRSETAAIAAATLFTILQ